MDVAIAGAGIGGLCAARALIGAGHRVRVLEAVRELRPLGAGLLLQPNAIRALEALELRGRVEACGASIRTGHVTTSGGRVLKRFDLTMHGRRPRAIAIHRGELQKLLVDALPQGTVELDQRVVGLESDAFVLHDGARVEADVAIGADGIHSAVAEAIGCPPLRYAGYTCWRGVTPELDLTALGLATDVVTELWGPGRRFGIVPIGQGRIYWFATDNRPSGSDCLEGPARDEVLELFSAFPLSAREVIGRTEEGEILHNDIVDRLPRTVWGQGRVTLIGDAAHPMTPNLGQGACQAIEDAVCLAERLRGASADEVESRLRGYEAERQPRTRKIVDMSYSMGRMGQLTGALPRFLRDLAIVLTPNFVTERQVLSLTG